MHDWTGANEVTYRDLYTPESSEPRRIASSENFRWFAGLVLALAALTGWARTCKQPADYRVAARVTVIQPRAVSQRPCGKYNSGTCEDLVPPQVHFAYDDGEVLHWFVNDNGDLRYFRHWGCYWVRMTPDRTVSRVIGEAPTQACP